MTIIPRWIQLVFILHAASHPHHKALPSFPGFFLQDIDHLAYGGTGDLNLLPSTGYPLYRW
jgi:hypothetical protein